MLNNAIKEFMYIQKIDSNLRNIPVDSYLLLYNRNVICYCRRVMMIK